MRNIHFASAQISSQRSSGGVGGAFDLTSVLLASGSSPGKDEKHLSSYGSPGTFQRDHTETKPQECVRAVQVCRTPSLLLLHGSFQNSGIQRGISVMAPAITWQPWPPKDSLWKPPAFDGKMKCVLLSERRHQGAGSCSVAPY